MIVTLKKESDKSIAVESINKLNLSKYGFTVKIEREKKRRSMRQNDLYWMWLNCIQHETGNGKDFLHDYFREKHLPVKEVEVFGSLMKLLTSTTSLSTVQFKDYLDYIQQFASAELGITLPNPDDLYFEQFKEYYKDKI